MNAREFSMDNCEQLFPVLVVDDSPVARKLVQDALPAEEFRILTAKTGIEALDLFALHRPGLVITDCVMPDLSGIEVCERLRTAFKESFTYIILVTSISEKSNIVNALQAGADDYITKPFHAAELLARVNVGRRFVEIHRQLEAKNRFLEQLALTDELTGLPNRRAIEEWAARQIAGAMRHKYQLWVVMADLDRLKSINDTHGHAAGDVVIKKFGEILKANTRRCDMCGRIGGDEFVMVVSHTEQEGVSISVERIREQVAAQTLTFGGHIVNTNASFGIAGLDRHQSVDFGRLMAKADVALHMAKRVGRNRVQMVPRIMQ
jgi:two-component system, cell cycle response regulator